MNIIDSEMAFTQEDINLLVNVDSGKVDLPADSHLYPFVHEHIQQKTLHLVIDGMRRLQAESNRRIDTSERTGDIEAVQLSYEQEFLIDQLVMARHKSKSTPAA